MKKILIVFAFFFGLQISAQAQADIQINPIAILFGGIQFSADFLLSETGSVELSTIAGEDVFGFYGAGKYYFNPREGADRFYIGAFAGGGTDLGGGVGFLLGQKWLSTKGVSFELAIGVGRSFGGDFDVIPYGKLAVGYRLGEKRDSD